MLRSQWPNVPEQELVELCKSWAARNACRTVVVFDGRAPDVLVGEEVLDAHCVVVGTGGESADDWIVRAASEHAAKREPYWLITSDRALRAAAGARAERTIGGGAFARTLTGS